MRRREFLGIAGGALAWPVAARAQQSERVRRIGVLSSLAENDAEGQARLAAFLQGLQQAGWAIGRNLHIDFRWAAGRVDDHRKLALELIALAPEVILTTGSAATAPLHVGGSVPVVFVNVIDPMGAGFVESLSRPDGHATGFAQFEYSTSGKWLELLKEIAPRLTRAAVLRDHALPSGLGQFAAIQSAAPALGMEVRPVNVRLAAEIERAVGTFANVPNGGLVVTGSSSSILHRSLIIALAARHKLPTVYNPRLFVRDGGLLSYGPNLHEQYREAAGYVDRILKGEKAADLPVQSASKYEIAINLKTAKTLGLTVSSPLLARADEVIE
jgi:putative tryptophan/tyrosine transport system substrate-binding protein